MSLDETIPAEVVQIHWDRDRSRSRLPIGEVVVFDRTKEDPAIFRADLPASWGACLAGWMAEPFYTPEGLYARWARTGFVSDQHHAAALEQLAKIKGCTWARRMADTIRDVIENERGC